MSIQNRPSVASVNANSTSRPSMFCRSESPDVVRWFEQHDPEAKPSPRPSSSIQVHHMHGSMQAQTIKSASVAQPSPSPTSRLYDAEEEIRCREALKLLDATELPEANSEAALELIEEAHTVEYSRTLVCNAPRELLWKTMLHKIRHPELYTSCCAGVKILYEGNDVLFREMYVGPDHKEHIKDKITWDEESETVRFTLYEDASKEGWIENAITSNASGQVCLTYSCHWTFLPIEGTKLTPQSLKQWRQGLRQAIDVGCAGTVASVEEEAARLREEDERTKKAIAAATQSKREEKENQSNGETKKGSPRVIQVMGKEM